MWKMAINTVFMMTAAATYGPSQPSAVCRMGRDNWHSVVKLCGWGVKAGWFILLVDDKRVG